ncbi:hypothetical protein E2P81_ATG10619 [Venturia nashicola]|nr:hypothetical protein E2P81_ATG10619 [Venturia nashicola]
MAANPTESSLAKTKTLKKPQRAPSSAVDPPKNKRFSSLGSLFRRSSTMTPRSSTHANAQAGAQASSPQSAAVTPKASKRLTKVQPPQQQQQQPQQQRQQYVQRPVSYYTNPPPGDYAAYEAMMRQHVQGQQQQYWQQQQQAQHVYSDPALMSSPYQQQPPTAAAPNAQQQSGYYHQGPSQTQYQQHPPQGRGQQYQTSEPNSRTHSLVGSPIAEQGAPYGYYGSPQNQSPGPSQAMPQPRRLHSGGQWGRDSVPGIPEANSPVDSSKNAPGAPSRSYADEKAAPAFAQGSPQQNYPGPARPTMETRQSSTYSQASVVRPPAMAQVPDNFPQAPGRQDYQTQYWQHQHNTQREPTLPQLQTQALPAHVQTTSVGSIDQQMARSPAKDYRDQQTPWAISLPQDGSDRNSAAAPDVQRQPTKQYRGAPAAALGAIRSQAPPQWQEDQYSVEPQYQSIQPQQMQNTLPQGQQRRSFYGEQVSSPTSYTATSPQQTSSPAPYTPASPRGQEYVYSNQYQNSYPHPQQQRQRNYPPQNRYYTQGPPPRPSGPQGYVGQNNEGRPLVYQRTPSGYSGRRDDAAVSEAELMNMRSASYPGQEWAPGRN